MHFMNCLNPETQLGRRAGYILPFSWHATLKRGVQRRGDRGRLVKSSQLMSNSHSAVLNQSWRNTNFTSGSRNIIVSSSNIMFAPFRIPFAWFKPVKYGWVYFRRRNTIWSLFRDRKTYIGMDIMISVIMLIQQ